jgi:hypothetical protein
LPAAHVVTPGALAMAARIDPLNVVVAVDSTFVSAHAIVL